MTVISKHKKGVLNLKYFIGMLNRLALRLTSENRLGKYKSISTVACKSNPRVFSGWVGASWPRSLKSHGKKLKIVNKKLINFSLS